MNDVWSMEPYPQRAVSGALTVYVRRSDSAIATWLLVCCLLVAAIAVIGGVTRLTHSGLSITEWQPVVGALPPLDGAQWQDAFAKYQATPEYREVNHGMTLAEFKAIFWWEYFHRLLGRAIGFAVLLPLGWFALRRRIPPRIAWPLAGVFALGLLQGALGWYMVKSGLVNEPRVSHLRLTAHLALAFVILGAMLWLALELLRGSRNVTDRRLAGLRRAGTWVCALVLLMVASGGLVAGTRAGFAYNTFPLMNGRLVPAEVLMIEPWYRNFVDNMATVQLDHRMIAAMLAIVVPAFCWKVLKSAVRVAAKRAALLLAGMLVAQIALGVATLLLVVPVALAAVHQAGAVLLFAAAVNVAHALRA